MIPAVSPRVPIAVLATLLLAGCNQTQATSAIDKLTPCKGYDAPVDAYCGTLKVYENRADQTGTSDRSEHRACCRRSAPIAKPDPFFFLAGGPGQGAAKMAKPLREMFRQMLTDRDIVLVDQRGTGKSNPLNCVDPRRIAEGVQRTRGCLDRKAQAVHVGLRRRSAPVYDADRDGRSR